MTNIIIGLILGYVVVAMLPYAWLSLQIIWELLTSVNGLFKEIYHLIRYGVQSADNTNANEPQPLQP